MIATALSGILAAGCAGGSEDVCTRAVQHLEACTGAVLQQLPDSCDQEAASRLLSTDCSQLAAEATRTKSSWWSSDFWQGVGKTFNFYDEDYGWHAPWDESAHYKVPRGWGQPDIDLYCLDNVFGFGFAKHCKMEME
jgi:hypothetical protein